MKSRDYKLLLFLFLSLSLFCATSLVFAEIHSTQDFTQVYYSVVRLEAMLKAPRGLEEKNTRNNETTKTVEVIPLRKEEPPTPEKTFREEKGGLGRETDRFKTR